MQIAETDRLYLRQFTLADAPFVLELLNSSGWLKWIGDRGVGTLDEAEEYIRDKMLDSYRQWDLGMYAMQLKGADRVCVGACGLVRRLDLDDIDLGFALLPDQEGRGLAFEASQAVMEYARGKLHLKRLIAITVPDNHRSVSLLTRLGMEKDGLITLGNEQLLRMAIEFS